MSNNSVKTPGPVAERITRQQFRPALREPSTNGQSTDGAVRCIQPTAVIGMGGTGKEIASRMKVDLTRQGIVKDVCFLLFDSDETARTGADGYAPFSEREFCHLPMEHLSAVLNEPERHPELAERFDLGNPQKLDFLRKVAASGTDQASQVRELGCLSLMASYGKAETAAKSTIADLSGIYRRLQSEEPFVDTRMKRRTSIIVICSASGGTGSGITHDIIAMLRDITEGMQVQIKLVVIQNDVFENELLGKPDQRERTMANDYCFHKELDALYSGQFCATSLRFGPSERDEIPVPNLMANDIILVGRKLPDGTDLLTKEAVYDSVAQHLTAEVGTAMAERIAADDANEATLRDLSPDPSTGRSRGYGTIGTTGVSISPERVADALCARQLKDFLKTVVIGDAASDLTSQAQAWMLRPIAKSPLTLKSSELISLARQQAAPSSTAMLAPAYRELTTTHKRYHRNSQFVKGASVAVEQFRDTHLSQIDKRLEAFTSQAKEKLCESLESRLEEITAAGGLRAMLSFLKVADVVLRATDSALKTELGEPDLLSTKAADETDCKQLNAALTSAEAIIQPSLSFARGLGRNRKLQDQAIGKVEAAQQDVIARRCKRAVRSILIELIAKVNTHQASATADLAAAAKRLNRVRQSAEEARPGKLATTRSKIEVDISTDNMDARLYAKYREDARLILGKLMSSGGNVKELFTALVVHDSAFQALTDRVRSEFLRKISHISVVDVIDDMLNDPTDASRVKTRIREAIGACQPLWQAKPGSLEIRFSDSLLIGLPATAKRSKFLRIEQCIRGLAGRVAYNAQQIEPCFVTTTDAYRINFLRRTHGGRPEYLPQVRDAYRAYKRWRLDGGHSLHTFNAKTVATMPDLIAEPKATEPEIAVAVALAYGLLARRGANWYLNVERAAGSDRFVCPLLSHANSLMFSEERFAPNSPAMKKFIALSRIEYALGDNPSAAQYLGDSLPEAVRELDANGELVELLMEVYLQLRAVSGNMNVSEDLERFAVVLTSSASPQGDDFRLVLRQMEVLRQQVAALRR